MTVKPIDLQTSINQLHEVARNQHASDAAVVNQQQFLDKEAAEKGNKADSHVDENKETHEVSKRDEGQPEGRRNYPRQKKDAKNEDELKSRQAVPVKDDRLGSIIDLRK